MPRFKPTNPAQGLFLPVYLDRQLQPGTFEFAINHIIDNELDLSQLETRYHNDEAGAPAYDPRVLLKIVLFAYSRGITSSRDIARCCQENVVFVALSQNSKPHFTTIASFIAGFDTNALHLFREVLLICDEMGLIGKEMFAVDGCKLSSNASKEWSGTTDDFRKKCAKLENGIDRIITRHRKTDSTEAEKHVRDTEKKYLATLKRQSEKIKKWLDDNDDKPGRSGTPIKSNITDNDSAKITSSKGTIQGYIGIAMVDKKSQVIVGAEAFGEATERNLLLPMVNSTRGNFQAIGAEKEIFTETKLTADSGFHTNRNMAALAEEEIDAYIADRYFRKRDPRFDDAGRYKERSATGRRRVDHSRKQFLPRDFSFDPELRFCICPAGKRMHRSGFTTLRGVRRAAFNGQKRYCRSCELRPQCLRHPDRTEIRQVTCPVGAAQKNTPADCAEKMKAKIDSVIGKTIYAHRIATAEPPFAHITHAMGLRRFSLRGKAKVNGQWLLFCTVHNLKKIFRHGQLPAAATS